MTRNKIQDTPRKWNKRERQLHKPLSLHSFLEESTKIQAILEKDSKILKLQFPRVFEEFVGYSIPSESSKRKRERERGRSLVFHWYFLSKMYDFLTTAL